MEIEPYYLLTTVAVVLVIGCSVLAAIKVVPKRPTLVLCAASLILVGWATYGIQRDVTVETEFDPHTYCADLALTSHETGDGDGPCARAERKRDFEALLPLGLGLVVLVTVTVDGVRRRVRSNDPSG